MPNVSLCLVETAQCVCVCVCVFRHVEQTRACLDKSLSWSKLDPSIQTYLQPQNISIET
jgi:hypothetical protein